jgi:hypothetical protein
MLALLRIVALPLLFSQLAWPAVAAACSCPAQVINSSDPKDGDTGWALNRALIVSGNLDPQSLELTDASGAAVEVDIDQGPAEGNCGGTWSELRPKRPLAGRTTYTLRALPDLRVIPNATAGSLTFSTGTELLPDPALAAPKGRVTMIEGFPQPADAPIGACKVKPVRACTGLDDGPAFEVIARSGGKMVRRWLIGHDWPDWFLEVPDCLEFRRRAATGKRSEPLTLCGKEALGVRAYRAGDDGLSCHDGLFEASDAGTSEPLPSSANDAGPAATPADDAAAQATAASDAGAVSTRDAGATPTRDVAAPSAHDVAAASAPANDGGGDATPGDVAKGQAMSSDASGDGCSLRPSPRSAASPALLALAFALALLCCRKRRRSR